MKSGLFTGAALTLAALGLCACGSGESEPAEVQQRLADALLRAPQPRDESATTTPVVEKKAEKAPAAKKASNKRKPSNKRQQVASR